MPEMRACCRFSAGRSCCRPPTPRSRRGSPTTPTSRSTPSVASGARGGSCSTLSTPPTASAWQPRSGPRTGPYGGSGATAGATPRSSQRPTSGCWPAALRRSSRPRSDWVARSAPPRSAADTKRPASSAGGSGCGSATCPPPTRASRIGMRGCSPSASTTTRPCETCSRCSAARTRRAAFPRSCGRCRVRPWRSSAGLRPLARSPRACAHACESNGARSTRSACARSHRRSSC